MFRVIANGPGNRGSIPGRVIPKNQLTTPFLTFNNIRYESRVSGAIQGKERPPPHFGVVAIEKGPFVLPSATVCQLTYWDWNQVSQTIGKQTKIDTL